LQNPFPGGVAVPADLASAARRAATIKNPKALKAAQMGVRCDEPDEIVEVRECDGVVYLPRGLALKRCVWEPPPLTRGRTIFDVPRERILPTGNNAPLRPHQKDAVAAGIAAHLGVLVAPPGAGKTWIGAALAGFIGGRVLVLVPTVDILDQWIEAFQEVLGVEAGRVGRGKHEWNAPAVVATYQSFRNIEDPDVIEKTAGFGTLIVDEAQVGASASVRRLLWLIGAPRRFGVTATPYRDDGLTKILGWHLGPIIHETKHDELIAAGYLRRVRVEKVETSFDYPLSNILRAPVDGMRRWLKDGIKPAWFDARRDLEHALSSAADTAQAGAPVQVFGLVGEDREIAQGYFRERGVRCGITADPKSWAKAMDTMLRDPDRMEIIMARAEADHAAGGTVLVLCGRIAVCEGYACAFMTRTGEDCIPLHSELKAKHRREGLAALRDGTVRCAFATTLADVGLDVPMLDSMVIAFPVRVQGRTVQRIGRLMRPDGVLAPVVYDLVDVKMGALQSQWASRVKAYRSIGAEVER